MSKQCAFYITNLNRQCKNKVKIQNELYCWCHRKKDFPKKKAPEKKIKKIKKIKKVFEVKECCICLESLSLTDKPFDCGHIVHMDCQIKSGKDSCPICRTKIKIPKKRLKEFNKYKKEFQEHINPVPPLDFFQEEIPPIELFLFDYIINGENNIVNNQNFLRQLNDQINQLENRH